MEQDINVVEELEVADDSVEVIEQTDDFSQESTAENEVADGEQQEQPFKQFNTQEEYQSHFDSILGQRLKKTRETVETFNKVQPILDLMQKKYGVDTLEQALEAYELEVAEQEAFNLGVTPEFYLDNNRTKRELAQTKAQLELQQAEQNQKNFIELLNKDIEKLKQEDSYLYGELKADEIANNDKILRLLADEELGMSLKTAYNAVFGEEIAKKIAEKTQKQVVDNIASRKQRPSENAQSGTAIGKAVFDVNSLSNKDIDEINKRVAMGEKITF